MGDRADAILRCFEGLKSSVPAVINAAHQELCQLLETAGAASDLMAIALSNPNESIRYHAIVLLGRILFKPDASYNASDLAQIREAILRLLQQETSDQNLCYAFSIAADCAKQYKESGGFGELVALLNELVKHEQKVPLCLAAWDMLISTECFTKEMLESVLPPLVDVISASLRSEESRFRSRAMALLQSIVVSGLANGIFAAFGGLLEAFTLSIQLALTQGNETEIMHDFYFVSLLVMGTEEKVELVYPNLYAMSREVLMNAGVSPAIRQYVLLFYAALIEVSPEMLDNDIEQLIDAAMTSLYEQCKIDQDEFEAAAADEFLNKVGTVEDWGEGLFEKIMTFAASNFNDPVALRIALACLSYICEPCTELFEDHVVEIKELLTNAMGVDDVFVYSQLCNLMQGLSEFVPACLTDISNLIAVMLERSGHPDSLPSLSVILMNSVEPIPNEVAVVEKLVSIVNKDNAGEVVSCITSVVANSVSVNEDFYRAIQGVLVKLLQEDVAHENVYECFSNCFKIAPRLVRDDVPMICEAMLRDLPNFQNPSAIGMVATAVGSLTLVLPMTMGPILPKLFDFFAGALENVTSDGDAENGEERVNDVMKGDILRCLGSIFSSDPNAYEAKFAPILTAIEQWLSSDDELFIGMAVKVIEAMNKGFRLINFSVDPLLDTILNNMEKVDDENAIHDMLTCLGGLLEEHGQSISDQSVQKLGAFLVDCLELRITSLCESRSIDTRFTAPLGYVVQSYVLGGAFVRNPEAGKLVNALLSHAFGKKKHMQAYALMSLARICFVVPQSMNEVAPRVLLGAIQTLSRPKGLTDSLKNTMFAALMYLLSSHGQLFNQDQLGAIFNGCEQCLSGQCQMLKETTSLVWLMLVTMFNVPTEPQKLAELVSRPLLCVDDEGMALYAQCLFTVQARSPELVQNHLGELVPIILATSKTYIQKVPAEILQQCVTLVKQSHEDQILISLKYNEAHLLELKRNVQ